MTREEILKRIDESNERSKLVHAKIRKSLEHAKEISNETDKMLDKLEKMILG